MKIIINEVHNKVYYGTLTVETRIGNIDYTYQLNSDSEMGVADDNWELSPIQDKGIHEGIKTLTDDEWDSIDEIIRAELYKYE